MPFELPIFPLNVVLFPGMPLPLHIFEPRYRLMIQRCLEADRIFGVAQLVEGQEGSPGTLPERVGTTAEIIEVAPFADGRMNLQTLGQRRFEILSVVEQDDYLVGTCEWLEDDLEASDIRDFAAGTRRVLSCYLDAMARNAELPVELGEIDIPHDAYALSMFIAAILQLPNNQRQELLEMTSTRNRLELEEFLLERAELVHRAYTKHAAYGTAKPPQDTSLGQFSSFVSLN